MWLITYTKPIIEEMKTVGTKTVMAKIPANNYFHAIEEFWRIFKIKGPLIAQSVEIISCIEVND